MPFDLPEYDHEHTESIDRKWFGNVSALTVNSLMANEFEKLSANDQKNYILALWYNDQKDRIESMITNELVSETYVATVLQTRE